ncbi:MAG: ATPase [Chromatiales bacterium]|nr:MAG: ATPase [Chromatiales bacterium]
MKKTIVAVVLGLIAPLANAEVTDAAANGFTTVNEVVISAGRAEAWVAATTVGSWWSSDHTVSGDASRLSIQPVTQGCFCESLGEQAGVVHLVVTMVNPTHMLRMTGGLGPLGLMGVDGNMTWEFAGDEESTRVRFTYAVGGYSPSGLDEIAPAVDFVMGEALGRLKAYVETGNPEPVAVD